MLKKLVVLGVVGFVAVSAVKGTKIGSYLRSEWNAIREDVEAKIPPEKEIARLRNEVKLLHKDLVGVAEQLAKEDVAVEQLTKKVADMRVAQGKEKELLNARAAAIDAATEQVSFGDRKLTIPAAKAELEDGVRLYQTNQKTLEGLEAGLATREKVRDSLVKQLETLKRQKAEMNAAIDALEVKLTNLKLQQMESRYQTDDTRLSKIKEDIQALDEKLDVARKTNERLGGLKESETVKNAGNKSVKDIMAPVNGNAPKPAGQKVPPIE